MPLIYNELRPPSTPSVLFNAKLNIRLLLTLKITRGAVLAAVQDSFTSALPKYWSDSYY